jgi:hypothetical protein
VKWSSHGGALAMRSPRSSRARRHFDHHLGHVVDVALRVGAAREREPHELHRRRLLAHDGSAFPNITEPMRRDRRPKLKFRWVRRPDPSCEPLPSA